MCTDCHINGTWESKEVGQLKIHMRVASHKVEGHPFWGELSLLKRICLKRINGPFPEYFTSLY